MNSNKTLKWQRKEQLLFGVTCMLLMNNIYIVEAYRYGFSWGFMFNPLWPFSKDPNPQPTIPPTTFPTTVILSSTKPPQTMANDVDPPLKNPTGTMSKAVDPSSTIATGTMSKAVDPSSTIPPETKSKVEVSPTSSPTLSSKTMVAQKDGDLKTTTQTLSENDTQLQGENATTAEYRIQPENSTNAQVDIQGGNSTGAEDSIHQDNNTVSNDAIHQENATATKDAGQRGNATASKYDIRQENDALDKAEVHSANQNDNDGSSSILQILAGKVFGENKTQDVQTRLEKLVSSLNSLAERGADSSKCYNDTAFLLSNVVNRQEWALKFIDAAGKPGPNLNKYRFHFVGDYHFCRSLVSERSERSFKGSYVVWNMLIMPSVIKLPAIKPFLLWGVCMPDTCTESENRIVAAKAIKAFGFDGILRSVRAEIRSDHREASVATYLSIIVICFIGVLVIAGTTFDIVYLQWPRWKEEEQETKQNVNGANGVLCNGQEKMPLPTSQQHLPVSDVNSSVTSTKNDRSIMISLHSGGKVSKYWVPIEDYGSFVDKEHVCESKEFRNLDKVLQVLLAFSVYTNGKRLLDTRQTPSAISCLHGIKSLSISWLLIGQLCFMPLGKGLYYNMPAEFRTYLQQWTFDVASNAYVCVDTFFTLSGFLVCYTTTREMEKKGWRLNWGMFYFHRFWRLTPSYMLTILLIVGLQQYCGEGPLWEHTQPSDKHTCEKYWWANVFYINNFFSPEKLCRAYSWYLSVDMQFFVVSPLIIVPFFFNPKLGLASSAFFLLIQVISSSNVEAHEKYSAAPILNWFEHYNSYFRHYYSAPWCRVGPYVVGIITGYFLSSKRDQIILNRLRAGAGWMLATAVALAITYGLHSHIKDVGIQDMPVATAAVYNVFAPTAWAAVVCWMIVACVTGWGGFLNTFLSWSPFVVLSRLVFMVYLIHVSILEIYFESQPRQIYFTGINFALTLIGLTVVCFAGAFVLVLTFELPMMNVGRIFLPKRRKD